MVVRRGDTVAILRGSFRDVEGRVSKVDRQRGDVYIEGVTSEKADGSARQIPVHSSKVVIRRLALDDKRRKEILERRAATPEPKAEEERPKSRLRGRRARTAENKGVEEREET